MGCSGSMVIGSTIMPLSLRLDVRSTSSAWRAMDMLRWTMPMPPCWARAMARCDSVTVSMAAEEMGMLRTMSRVKLVRVSTSAGITSLRAGSSKTSSKVRPSMSVSWDHRGLLFMRAYGERGAINQRCSTRGGRSTLRRRRWSWPGCARRTLRRRVPSRGDRRADVHAENPRSCEAVYSTPRTAYE